MAWNGDYESEAYGVESSTSTSSSTSSGNTGDNNDSSSSRQAYNDQYGGVSTRNFNVSTSGPSVTQGGVTTYGTQSQLNELFGADVYNTTVDSKFSMGGGRTTISEMVGYAGKMSPTTMGNISQLGRTGVGTRNIVEGGSYGYSLADSLVAQNNLKNFGSVGKGLRKPEVVEIVNGRAVVKSPAIVGLAEGQRALRGTITPGYVNYTKIDGELNREVSYGPSLDIGTQMAYATGQPYASSLANVAVTGALGTDIGKDSLFGIEAEKGTTVSYEIADGFEVAGITNEMIAEEYAMGALGGPMGALMFGSPDLAEVVTQTGKKGVYTDMGGIVGAIEGGPYVSFSDRTSGPDNGDSDQVTSVPTPTPNLLRRFQSRLKFNAPSISRFPTSPRARAPRMLAATGGYVADASHLKEGVKNKKRGYHAYAVGGQVYGVAPDKIDPTKSRAYGGTMDQVKNVIGGAFGYDPTTLDLNKFPGEEGFGQDLLNYLPGIGGYTAQNKFIPADGNMTDMSAQGYMQRHTQKMALGGVASGFVGARPEQLDPQQTVEDSVPIDVPEGTFVLNGPATEYAGSKDVEEMLNKATQYAQKAGIDIEKENARISSKGLVQLAVSPGEVLIDPVRASIIGLDTLNKMNNRGEKEVARRQEEAKQKPVDQQMRTMAAQGGVQGLYQYGSVKAIDEQADMLLTQMRTEINSRLEQIDRSVSSEEGIAQRAKITQDVMSKYHDQLRSLKENSDPYAFQMFQDRNTEKTLDLQNALEFGDYGSEREQRLADKATTSVNIPFGGEDDKTLGDTGLVGFAYPYIGEDGDKTAYVSGKNTEKTNPSSTARHETAHLEFKGRENLQLTPINIGGTIFKVNEEQLLRLIDLDRTKNEGLEGEYERAMKFITESPRNKIRAGGIDAILRLSTGITREEIESNLPSIIEQINKAQSF